MAATTRTSFLFLLALVMTSALQPPPPVPLLQRSVSRRAALLSPAAATLTAAAIAAPGAAQAATPNGLELATSAPSGLRWADAKVGSGQAARVGTIASIDFSMSSTGGRSPKIYSNKDAGAPYRWVLGDGSTIKGIELAVLGEEGGRGGGRYPSHVARGCASRHRACQPWLRKAGRPQRRLPGGEGGERHRPHPA